MKKRIKKKKLIGRKFKGFKVYDKLNGRFLKLETNGECSDEDYFNDICYFSVNPSGELVVFNNNQDYFMDNPEERYKVLFN